jgi:3',5'-cyclic-AMP phosphodiesterase
MFRVAQFSDTHFSTPGHRSHGGFGYDTDAAWDAVVAHAFPVAHKGDNKGDSQGGPKSSKPIDYVVVTGDIADNGRADEYAVAARQLARIPVPANICSGNHDYQVPFDAGLPRPGLTQSRTLRIENWLFLFADSNFAGREIAADGSVHDREDRREESAEFGSRERAWIAETLAATDADHAFIWAHHPPYARGLFNSETYNAELESLFKGEPKLRGMGAGHTHTDIEFTVGERTGFVCPALTINIDFVNKTTLPPGYRTYEFSEDGNLISTCHLIEDKQWPRRNLPDASIQWILGEISFEEMRAALGLPPK